MSESAEIHGYEDRYVAFLDILGFANVVVKSETDPELFRKLRYALDTIYTADPSAYWTRVLGSDSGSQATTGMSPVRVTTFSDSIVLSSDSSEAGLSLLLMKLEDLCTSLLVAGILTRGGICLGSLYHGDSIVFGTGLIRAYRLESQVANYPRIVIDDGVCTIINELTEKERRLYAPIKRDFDGLYFLDYLRNGLEHLIIREQVFQSVLSAEDASQPGWLAEGKDETERLHELFHEIGALIESNMDEARKIYSSVPGIAAKHRWYARYFNEVIEAREDLELAPVRLE